ncbi:hypothetical protein K493DRAFT_306300 [Basidiobolus meristosporus CBS 931.73]|uniref:Fibronectin type-III domain-containing protein n=1 Tax=Basidiobolus meristosporus CBS 931.73 TaxID=1314790 RepID=A0A1Y1XSV9_9FUNG|nr:hypothetical protein K493DRAFT_306300 [Basidiobolus meristosporus CBS 931.73]|eukprot:ORX88818.1 hypothetical protein K493DRAFT_306300 [Basidiobolus meristosporus CBS 931.73]
MKFSTASIPIAIALAAGATAAPVGSPSQCNGWAVSSLEHAAGPKPSTFSSNDKVIVKWTSADSQVTTIREVDLFSAKDHQFLHTQYRSYPGVSVSNGQLPFTLSVPLCLQRDGEYYIRVYSSTPGQDMDCYSQTPVFKLTPDPKGNFTQCTN